MVGYEHVGLPYQPAEDLLPLGFFEVDGDGALVPVGAFKQGIVAAGQVQRNAHDAAPGTSDVPGGVLYLDYIGPQVPQHVTGGRPVVGLGPVDYSDSIE